jgi:probable phosphoglycerate mutase
MQAMAHRLVEDNQGTPTMTADRPLRQGRRTIYIVRHGATKYNGEPGISVDRERGWSDVPLTEEGREEARKAGAALKGKGLTAIVSSDLVRARETALIIGRIIGIKPEFSYELRPWNLGDLTGKDLKQANPEICAATKAPDKPVKGGESFNSFKARAFQGIDDAVRKHRDPLLIVCHHRVERLVAGWVKAGEPASHAINLNTFLEQGDPPGGIIILHTSEAALGGSGKWQSQNQSSRSSATAPPRPTSQNASNGRATKSTKLAHSQVHFGSAKGKDRCGSCKAFIGTDNCKKVVPPIDADDWCAVGVSKADGHRFDPRGEAIEAKGGLMPKPEKSDMKPRRFGALA